MKDHKIAELVNAITKKIEPLCPGLQSVRMRVSGAIVESLKEIEDGYFELEEDSEIGTDGGEGWLDHDYHFAEYGIRLGEVHIGNISPLQMIYLAQVMVDHLLINGHKFEIQKTGEQDQRERLVCLDLKEDVE